MVVELSADVAPLPVSEVFGPTIQGEGPAAGHPATFVRFMGCNLSCSWCDTAYTWDGSRYDLAAERRLMDAQLVGRLAVAGGTDVIVLTGGEPLLQQEQPGWRQLLGHLEDHDRRIHLETNGTIPPTELSLAYLSLIVVSPKLGNAGPHRGHQDPALHPDWMGAAGLPWVHLKFVCQTPEDVAFSVGWAAEIGWPRDRVWVMPEGATADELAQRWPAVAEAAARRGVNASHRLHVLAWGTERGH